MRISRSAVISSVVALTLAVATPALAGPPLLCHPYDIGSAKTLPWGAGWSDASPAYDLSHLVSDTEAFLTPSTPVIVRMETLRRASLYASRDETQARALVERLTARIRASKDPDPIAMLDAAYAGEALREAGLVSHQNAIVDIAKTIDPWTLVDKSLAIHSNDATFEFDAAMIYAGKDRAISQAHAERARQGAKGNDLLTRNLTHLN